MLPFFVVLVGLMIAAPAQARVIQIAEGTITASTRGGTADLSGEGFDLHAGLERSEPVNKNETGASVSLL